MTGPAQKYVLKYSTSHISTDADWSGASELTGEPTPGAPGSSESYSFTIPSGTQYYVRLRARDDFVADDRANSLMSNEVLVGCHLSCNCVGGGMFAGGGGGGGSSLVKAPGTASLLTAQQTTEQSFFGALAVNEGGIDAVRLPAPAASGGVYGSRVRQQGAMVGALDRVRLLVVDHPSGARAYWSDEGAMVGTTTDLVSARVDGADVPGELSGSEGSLIIGPGHVLALGLPPGAAGAVLTWRQHGGVTSDSSGALLQVRDSSGAWTVAGHLAPHTGFDDLAVSSHGGSETRIATLGSVEISAARALQSADAGASLHWLAPTGAEDSRAGDVTSALAGRDSTLVPLSADTLALSFEVPGATDTLTRDAFLVLEGVRSADAQVSPARLHAAGPTIPLRFALHQNQPNPFHGGTTIRFDLPVGQFVSIDVYDLQGRHVRQLLNRFVPAGFQSVRWDQRDGAGIFVRPGVFFCTLRTSLFRGRKKLVLLP